MTRQTPNSRRKKDNPHKPKRDFKSYLKFVAIGIVLMFFFDKILWKEERPYITKMKEEYYAEQAEKERLRNDAIEKLLPPKIVFPDNGDIYFQSAEPELKSQIEVIEPEVSEVIEEPVVPPKLTIKAEPIVKQSKINTYIGRPKIAIVIDDVGMNLKQSRASINLDPAVTLAFLPYAVKVRELSQQAIEKGHEVIIHTPMEAMDSEINLGSLALRNGMNADEFRQEFNKIANSFEGYNGINNHMGSRLTQDKAAMQKLMRELKARGLYFLDSKTIASSIAAETAREYGVPVVVRDVFLDHEEDLSYVQAALKKTESVAREHGVAIAIGHPKQNTMDGLRSWLKTIESKGFDLVPLKDLIK